jgi:hypothetical protein
MMSNVTPLGLTLALVISVTLERYVSVLALRFVNA